MFHPFAEDETVRLVGVEAGGETSFCNIGKDIAPRRGMAVIWNSLNHDGSPNRDTMHHGTPVLAGYKAIITKWFRTGGGAGGSTSAGTGRRPEGRGQDGTDAGGGKGAGAGVMPTQVLNSHAQSQ